MKIKLFLFLVMLLALSACSSFAGSKGTPIPLTPTLEPAINFEKGLAQVPQGYYLFIEYYHRSIFSYECNVAPGPPAPPRYSFASGVLTTSQSNITSALSSPIVGLFGLSLGPNNELRVIDELPYKAPPYDEFTLYSVDAQGIATVEIAGNTYFIKPDQSWIESGDIKQEPPGGCHVAYTTKVSNYGLLPKTKIRFVDSLPWRPF